MAANPFVSYYRAQALGGGIIQGGGGAFNPTVYRGRVIQRGQGAISNFFSRLWQRAAPLVASAGKGIAHHLLSNAVQFGDDLITGKADLKRDARRRAMEVGRGAASIALNNLKSQMGGRMVHSFSAPSRKRRRLAGGRPVGKLYKGANRVGRVPSGAQNRKRLTRAQLFG